jgi:hypothetical protein
VYLVTCHPVLPKPLLEKEAFRRKTNRAISVVSLLYATRLSRRTTHRREISYYSDARLRYILYLRAIPTVHTRRRRCIRIILYYVYVHIIISNYKR